ncbi:MAG: zf-HC2 domain-containing protein [Thermoanaerobaculia bacterium]
MADAVHLDEHDFERWMMGELSPGEAERARSHIAACEECRRIHAALVEVARGARAFDAAVPASRSAAPRRPLLWVGLAAAVLAAVLVLPWLRPDRRTESDGALRAATMSPGPSLIEPLGIVSEIRRLVWTPVPGAESYRVELLDAEAEPLWTSEPTTATAVPWPSAVAPEPGTYYWRVLARLPGGAETGASELGRFELAP